MNPPSLLTLAILAGIVGGFIFPAISKIFEPGLAPLLMALIFLTSLKIRLNDLFSDLRRPENLIIGLVLILFVIPLLATLVPTIWPTTPMAYVGILIYLASPAATSTAFFAEVLKGRPALGLNLSALSLLFSIVTIPAIVLLLAGNLVQVYVMHIIITLIQIIIIPFIAAMVTLRFFPKVAAKMINYSFPASLTLVFLIFIAFVGAGYEQIVGNIGEFISSSIILSVLIILSFIISYGIANIMRMDKSECITIALGAGVKNGAIGLFIALAAFGPAVIPSIIAGGLLNVFIMLIFGKVISK